MEKLAISKETNQTPLNITFTYQKFSKKITLKNTEDVLKLADIFSELLTKYEIEHTIENFTKF